MLKITKLLLIGMFSVCVALTSVTAENKDNKEYSDTWLQSKLVTTYLLNRHLSVFDIDTEVKNQVVYLAGEVDSEVDKDLAGEVAKSIKGVNSVENNLTVAKTKVARNKAAVTERSFGQQVSDMTTTASIKTKLLADQNVSGLSVNVDTLNDVVTLKGEVKSDAEKALVEQIAKNTDDVDSVNNQLKVVTK